MPTDAAGPDVVVDLDLHARVVSGSASLCQDLVKCCARLVGAGCGSDPGDRAVVDHDRSQREARLAQLDRTLRPSRGGRLRCDDEQEHRAPELGMQPGVSSRGGRRSPDRTPSPGGRAGDSHAAAASSRRPRCVRTHAATRADPTRPAPVHLQCHTRPLQRLVAVHDVTVKMSEHRTLAVRMPDVMAMRVPAARREGQPGAHVSQRRAGDRRCRRNMAAAPARAHR